MSHIHTPSKYQRGSKWTWGTLLEKHADLTPLFPPAGGLDLISWIWAFCRFFCNMIHVHPSLSHTWWTGMRAWTVPPAAQHRGREVEAVNASMWQWFQAPLRWGAAAGFLLKDSKRSGRWFHGQFGGRKRLRSGCLCKQLVMVLARGANTCVHRRNVAHRSPCTSPCIRTALACAPEARSVLIEKQWSLETTQVRTNVDKWVYLTL